MVENRGGARPGSGRKPGSRETLGFRQVKKLLELEDKRHRKHGYGVADIILDAAYDAEATRRDRHAACKLWMDLTVVRVSEGSEADQALGPAVFLPEHRPVLSVVPSDKVA